MRSAAWSAGVAYNFDGRLQAGMGVAVGDYEGNGLLDIAKSNFSGDLPSLYANEGHLFFSDVSQQAGLGKHQLLGWGIAFLDVDEDGWKDLVIANGHVYPEVDNSQIGESYRQKTLLYRNLGNGRFEEITDRAGPAFQQLRPARGLATGDLDGAGRPAIVIANMNETPSLLKNQSPAPALHPRAPGGHQIEPRGHRGARHIRSGRAYADRRGDERRQLSFPKRCRPCTSAWGPQQW